VPERLTVERQHVLRFHPTRAGQADASDSLRAVLAARQVGDRACHDVELVFEEIAGNIIRHGLPTADVGVRIDFRDDEITLAFVDDGVPFDPREQPSPLVPTSIDDAPVGGLGLVLVRKLARHMDYERTADERNHLTLAISAR
jgi:serine/threonine-protein kinase RsbW